MTETPATDSPITVWTERDGTLLRIRLARPDGNIVDTRMLTALAEVYSENKKNRDIKAALLDHEGPHFSYGASVEEHLPGKVAPMLRQFHTHIAQILSSRIPLLVAVRGQCLGGGLEIALCAHLVFVHPEARLGQPEIRLGVIAPVASCVLPERVGQARADDLLISGRLVNGREAVGMGMAAFVADDPQAAALEYFDTYLAPKSPSSLRHALRASRMNFRSRVLGKLSTIEDLYLTDLMGTRDAVEGLEAFLAKREPQWENR